MADLPGMQPYVVQPGQGRSLPHIGRLLASGGQTGGSFEVFELEDPATPPPHVHRQHDEAFYVTEGRFTFVLGGDTIEAHAGSFLFVARGTRHGFTIAPGSKGLLIVSPAGLEGFFDELGRGLTAGRPPSELREALAEGYDSTPA